MASHIMMVLRESERREREGRGVRGEKKEVRGERREDGMGIVEDRSNTCHHRKWQAGSPIW